MPTITMTPHRGEPVEVRFEPPTRLSFQSKVLRLSVVDQYEAGLAAIALCWRGTDPRPPVRRHEIGMDMRAVAGLAEDRLLERGFRLQELARVGVEAFSICVQGIVPEADEDEHEGADPTAPIEESDPVAEQADFSEAQTGAATSS